MKADIDTVHGGVRMHMAFCPSAPREIKARTRAPSSITDSAQLCSIYMQQKAKSEELIMIAHTSPLVPFVI
jgi:hypothetical protein